MRSVYSVCAVLVMAIFLFSDCSYAGSKKIAPSGWMAAYEEKEETLKIKMVELERLRKINKMDTAGNLPVQNPDESN